jgi:MFS family permease
MATSGLGRTIWLQGPSGHRTSSPASRLGPTRQKQPARTGLGTYSNKVTGYVRPSAAKPNVTGASRIGRSAAPSVRHQKETDARLVPTVCPRVDTLPAKARRDGVGGAATGILKRRCHRGTYVVSHRRDRSRMLIRQGPLAGRYPAVAAMVMCALIPYLAISAALNPLTPIIAKQLHTNLQTMSLSAGLANAAYAVGTVLAVQLAQHLPQRRMMLAYAVLLVIGSVLAAAAQNAGMFIVGHVIQGLCTSLLLIAAVPPLALGYPRDKLRDTAVIMNLCIFGAVALGPFIGGLQAEANAWRPLFWIVAGISVAALLLVVLTYDDAPPANPDSPRDLRAIGLATVGCVAAFFGAAQLTTHRFLDPVAIVPMVGGLATIVVLVVYQYRAKRPLLTIRTMLTSSIPVAGVTLALFAAAASVSATALTVEVLTGHYSPLRIGVLFLPEVGGAVITAIVLGLVLQRRAIHYLPLVGMIVLAAGIAVFRVEVPPSQALTLVGSALTGIGLGATVAPALFVAGFSLASANLQRVFAIVELLRAVAAFMVAPIFIYFASTISGSLDEGAGIMLLVGIGLAIAGAISGVAVYALSGARPQAPDLNRFLSGTAPAWYSPPLLARLGSGPSDRAFEPESVH